MTSSEPCREYEELLGAALSGDITREERRRLLAHTSACPACRAAYGELTRFRGSLLESYRIARPTARTGQRIARWAGLAVAASLLAVLVLQRFPTTPTEVASARPAPTATAVTTTASGTLAAATTAVASEVVSADEQLLDVDAMFEHEVMDMMSDQDLEECFQALETGQKGISG